MNPAASIVQQVFAAAGNAGWLVSCSWVPKGKGIRETAPVSLSSEDHLLMDHLARSTDPLIRFPASNFVGIKRGDLLVIGANRYQVREVENLKDGSIKQAKVTTI